MPSRKSDELRNQVRRLTLYFTV